MMSELVKRQMELVEWLKKFGIYNPNYTAAQMICMQSVWDKFVPKDKNQNNLTINGQQIATWYSEGAEPEFIAVNMTKAIERLEGYELTQAEKINVDDLMAGYCRLLDEAQLIGYGDTEFESIKDLFRRQE